MTEAFAVVCPECEARVGEPCVYWYYGQDYPRETHEARYERAYYLADLAAQGICTVCEAGHIKRRNVEVDSYEVSCDNCDFVEVV